MCFVDVPMHPLHPGVTSNFKIPSAVMYTPLAFGPDGVDGDATPPSGGNGSSFKSMSGNSAMLESLPERTRLENKVDLAQQKVLPEEHLQLKHSSWCDTTITKTWVYPPT